MKSQPILEGDEVLDQIVVSDPTMRNIKLATKAFTTSAIILVAMIPLVIIKVLSWQVFFDVTMLLRGLVLLLVLSSFWGLIATIRSIMAVGRRSFLEYFSIVFNLLYITIIVNEFEEVMDIVVALFA